MLCLLSWVFWAVLLFSPVMYLVLNSLLPMLAGPQDLKRKYKASWGLVTGASSGIGKALAHTLLGQGLDLVLVSRGEPMFDQAVAEMKQKFPDRELVQINADLSDASGAWMEEVRAATTDKDPQVCFLNAGYIVTGMFESHKVQTHLANLHCNLTANIWLAHHLYSRMISKQLPGCIVFTSSSASYIPNPFACLYATTKAGLSAFAASLACEARARGVHVHSIHPSPVHSRFTSGGGNTGFTSAKIEAMAQFYKFGVQPEDLPGLFTRHVGRAAVVADIGGVSMGLRLVVHFLGYNFMAFMTAVTAFMTPDYKNNVGKAEQKKEK